MCLIFATIVVFLMFFNTYVFQAGLVGYLVKKFKFTVLILFLYFAMCISLHIWTMVSVLNFRLLLFLEYTSVAIEVKIYKTCLYHLIIEDFQ